MQVRSIKKINPLEIEIEWDDTHQSKFTLKQLRDICPCAGCQGEDILLHHIPPVKKNELPEQYHLSGIKQVGSYAVQMTWGDGHNAGIYTWEYLADNCPCELCSDKRFGLNFNNKISSEGIENEKSI
ncbi:MAG: DUF971 domain-containing protein [Ignavibacteriales bacterium]|nr:DUF971 domain-containing protein [Ignavibacteriales bacterium]